MPINVENLTFTYMPKTPYAKTALDNISFSIEDGELFGIIGSTGSGKSTLIQHFNGLLRATSGKITVNGIDLSKKKFDYKTLRSEVGLVFQYPEYQLFDETVKSDVAFGPKNLKLPQEEIDARVREAIELVGLNYDEVAEKAPFDLSGGQKRRVAIAGVIAMRPKILVLDEPSAGLDPKGKKEILDLIQRLRDTSPTVIIISHDMDEIAGIADRIAVLDKGKLLHVLPPEKLFEMEDEITRLGLDLPETVKIYKALKERGITLPRMPVRKTELAKLILDKYKENKGAF